MNNTENVTIGLLTITAVILAAVIFVQTDEPAYAASSPDRSGNYVVVAGQISSAADLVYVVNGATKTLLAYHADQRNGRIKIVARIDLEKEFRRQGR